MCESAFADLFVSQVIDKEEEPEKWADRAAAVQRIKNLPCKRFQTGDCHNPNCMQAHRIVTKEELAKIAEERKEKKVKNRKDKKSVSFCDCVLL